MYGRFLQAVGCQGRRLVELKLVVSCGKQARGESVGFFRSFPCKNQLAKGESGPDFGSLGSVTDWDANGCHCGYVSFDRGDLRGLCGLSFLGNLIRSVPDRVIVVRIVVSHRRISAGTGACAVNRSSVLCTMEWGGGRWR